MVVAVDGAGEGVEVEALFDVEGTIFGAADGSPVVRKSDVIREFEEASCIGNAVFVDSFL